MAATETAAIVLPVAAETRGQAIERRMLALGMNYTSLGDQAGGLYRQTVKRATEDHPSTRPATYAQLEAALDRIEQETGQNEPGLSGPQIVVVRLRDGDREVAVEGPVDNLEALEAAADRLLRRMSREGDT